MPELPEVETTRKGLLKAIEGDVIRDVATYTSALRFPLPDNMHERLAGCKVLHVARRAKYLLIRLSGGQELLVHLGMSGRFQVLSKNSVKPPRQKHDHVIFRTERGARKERSVPCSILRVPEGLAWPVATLLTVLLVLIPNEMGRPVSWITRSRSSRANCQHPKNRSIPLRSA